MLVSQIGFYLNIKTFDQNLKLYKNFLINEPLVIILIIIDQIEDNFIQLSTKLYKEELEKLISFGMKTRKQLNN